MESMLSFITGLIKERDISTDEFIKMSGLNRSQFYRGVKDPQAHFKKSDLVHIAKVLDLGEVQKENLFAYKSMKDPEQEEVYHLAARILHDDPNEYEDERSYNYDFHEPYIGNKPNIHKWSDEVLVGHLVDLFKTPEGEQKMYHRVDVTIYNCFEHSIMLALASLFLRIKKAIIQYNLGLIRIDHFINLSEDQISHKSTAKRLEQLHTIMPLISVFSNYSFIERSLSHPLLTKHDNLCLIKYERGMPGPEFCKTENHYFLLNLNKKNNCHMTTFDESHRHLYDYFQMDTLEKTVDRTKSGNSLNFNAWILREAVAKQRIMYHRDLCLDNIEPRHWLKFLEPGRLEQKYKDALAKALDPHNALAVFDSEQALLFNIDYLGKRYEANEAMGMKTILSSIGLAEFAGNGYFSDFDFTLEIDGEKVNIGRHWKFTPPELIEILENVRERLGKSEEGESRQEYYFLKPQFQKRENTFSIIQNSCIIVNSPNSIHRLVGTLAFEDKDAANAMFSYLTNQVINRQDSTESILMTDAEARKHIDRLISGLQKKITPVS